LFGRFDGCQGLDAPGEAPRVGCCHLSAASELTGLPSLAIALLILLVFVTSNRVVNNDPISSWDGDFLFFFFLFQNKFRN